MVQIITRAGWGAKPPSKPLTPVSSTRGVKVHYTGGWVDPRIVDDHRECLALMLSIQRMHMAGGREQPYSDFGYNMAACCHRRVLIGRGPNVVPAANGAGLNTAHYAVLALVGNKGYTVPSDDLLHAVLDAIDYLRKHGGAGREIKCHRDGYATDCPGDRLTTWVRRGAPRPVTPAPTAPAKPATKPATTEVLVKKLPDLKLGDGRREGDPLRWDVKTLHYLLMARAAVDPVDLVGVDDTQFQPIHATGVRAVQQRAGLPQTGRVDAATWAALLRVK